jgi:hypothetical protein
MARRLGYGGVSNTNGARDFTSKVGVSVYVERVLGYGGIANSQARDFSGKTPAVVGAWIPKPYIPIGAWQGN